MALYTYVKSTPTPTPPQNPEPPLPHLKKRFSFTFRLGPALSSVVGIALLFSVISPILSYELTKPQENYRTASGLLNPLSENRFTAQASGPRVVSDTDYTKASNWFTTSPSTLFNNTPATFYTVSIPKLKIDEATVIVGTEDLSKSLIHYNGTALPGQPGSPVIFGHSILPQFFNPKNYMSIFSTLPTLDVGDPIVVKHDGVVYTYRVFNKLEVYPDNVSVLEQNYDTKEIKLITCVPPGLKTRRLVVVAKLE